MISLKDHEVSSLMELLQQQELSKSDNQDLENPISQQVVAEEEFDKRQDEILDDIEHELSTQEVERLYKAQGLEYRLSRSTRSAERRISRIWRLYQSKPEVANFRTDWLAAKPSNESIEEIERRFKIWQTEITIIEAIAKFEGWEFSVEENDGEEDRAFTKFLDLPRELRWKVWNYAFPPRVVNIEYDGERDSFISFNSLPLLLKIHRESRYYSLRSHRLSFATDTQDAKIYFDHRRDILTHTWFSNKDPTAAGPRVQFGKDVQNLTISALCLQDQMPMPPPPSQTSEESIALKARIAEDTITELVERFPSVNKLYITFNETPNPYSRSPIRLFTLDHIPKYTEHKGDRIEIYSLLEKWQDIVKGLGNTIMVGAWQGGSRSGLEGFLKDVEDDDNDEYFDPSDEKYDSEDGSYFDPIEDDTDSEDDDQEEETFGFYSNDSSSKEASNDEEIHNSTFIPEEEREDLLADEKSYKAFCEEENNSYEEKQGFWMSPDYYEMRTQIPGRCYHVYYPDGSYIAS